MQPPPPAVTQVTLEWNSRPIALSGTYVMKLTVDFGTNPDTSEPWPFTFLPSALVNGNPVTSNAALTINAMLGTNSIEGWYEHSWPITAVNAVGEGTGVTYESGDIQFVSPGAPAVSPVLGCRIYPHGTLLFQDDTYGDVHQIDFGHSADGPWC